MTPAPPSLPSLPQTVKDQCPPAGHQDSLMGTVLTLVCVALMDAAILVENVGHGEGFPLFVSDLLLFSAQAQVKAVPQTLPTTTTEGYDYEPPKVTLPVRPKKITTTTQRTTTTKQPTTTTTTELELLYGVPRQGRNLSNR